MTPEPVPAPGPASASVPPRLPTPRAALDDTIELPPVALPPTEQQGTHPPVEQPGAAEPGPSEQPRAAESSAATSEEPSSAESSASATEQPSPAESSAPTDGYPLARQASPTDGRPPTGQPSPRPPARRATPAAPPLLAPPPGSPRVYADGTALSRFLVGAPARDAWLAWVGEHEAELVTTPLGLSELRRIAQPRGLEARGTAHDVAARIEVTRFSDQTLRKATTVTSVLPPFLALHLGAALAHPDVTAVATYDVQLARVAALHGLRVVTPGWPQKWWELDPTPWG